MLKGTSYMKIVFKKVLNCLVNILEVCGID